ncbi:MAG: ABC transporter ATP-binding protein [Chitinophagales bacterium]|nr:ABC transporter ATP-binding protein [Chitinophagales bacterium]
MSRTVIKVENLYKQYRLGQVSTGTLAHDINRWWHQMRGLEDPYEKITTLNNRTDGDESEYVWALQNINFEVKQGEVLGIIGKNGAGKSTLLKLLSKVTSPTKGSIKVNGRVASLLEVGTGFHKELTGRENVFLNGAILGMTKVEINRKFDEIVAFSGIGKYIDTPVKRYSSGMYVRLAFAVAAHLDPEIMIIDEVLAVGDIEFQKKCLGKMKDVSEGGRTVLFVSHNMAAVKTLCTRAILMNNGTIFKEGDTSHLIDEYIHINNNFSENGIIARNAQRIHQTGEAFFEKVQVIDKANEPVSIMGFKSTVQILAEIHVEKEISDAIFAFSILNSNNDKIVFTEFPENSFKHIMLQPGRHRIKFVIPVQMNPGTYYISPNVMKSSGESIDYLENVYKFEVTKDATEGSHHYRWNISHGNVYGSAQNLSIDKIS